MSGDMENAAPAAEEAAQKETELTKYTFRKQVWDRMKENSEGASNPFYRIPNFGDVERATERLRDLPAFQNARNVLVAADKPLEHARNLVLSLDKNLYVPVPRMKQGFLAKFGRGDIDTVRKPVVQWKQDDAGEAVDLDHEVRIDLVVIGSVAVSRKGHRIGKGRGYADLEYAVLREMKAVDDGTVVVTIVHQDQVFDELPGDLFRNYDLPVDFVLTPEQVLAVDERLERPQGVYWELLTRRRLADMGVLRRLRAKRTEEGVDTTLKKLEEEGAQRRFRNRRFRNTPRGGGGGAASNGESGGNASSDQPNNRDDRKFKKRRFRRKNGSSSEKEGPDSPKGSPKSGQQKPSSNPRPRNKSHRHFDIDFSLLISNIERDVRVRDLKNTLIEHNMKPDDITWRGYKGYCLLHYAKHNSSVKPAGDDKENEGGGGQEEGAAIEQHQQPFSRDSVIEVLQKLQISGSGADKAGGNGGGCKLDVKVMEPITRIVTTDVTSV